MIRTSRAGDGQRWAAPRAPFGTRSSPNLLVHRFFSDASAFAQLRSGAGAEWSAKTDEKDVVYAFSPVGEQEGSSRDVLLIVGCGRVFENPLATVRFRSRNCAQGPTERGL